MAAEMVLGEVNPELFHRGEGGLRLTADAPTGPVVTELLWLPLARGGRGFREASTRAMLALETEVPKLAPLGRLSPSAGHRFVALVGHEVVGFVVVRPTSDSPLMGGVVEDSLYVSGDLGKRHREVGLMLLEHLVASTESVSIWTVQAGILPEDKAAIALHKRAGFRAVGSGESCGEVERHVEGRGPPGATQPHRYLRSHSLGRVRALVFCRGRLTQSLAHLGVATGFSPSPQSRRELDERLRRTSRPGRRTTSLRNACRGNRARVRPQPMDTTTSVADELLSPWLGNSCEISIPTSAMAATVAGLTSVPGSEPPDQAIAFSPRQFGEPAQGHLRTPCVMDAEEQDGRRLVRRRGLDPCQRLQPLLGKFSNT